MPDSIALSEFKASLRMAEELMRLERTSCRNPPRATEVKTAEGLRGGAAVLMVAAFEYFLRACTQEHLAPLTVQPLQVEFGKLPEPMRVHSVYTTLEHAMKGAPYTQTKERKDRLSDIDAASRLILSGTVNPVAFSATGGNPGPETVKAMWKVLGMPDVLTKLKSGFESKWRKPVSQTFIADKLTEIVNRRHVVAHTANALNIGRTDLKEGVRFLRTLAELLDRELSNHVKAIIRAA
jgi:hypothetical protein